MLSTLPDCRPPPPPSLPLAQATRMPEHCIFKYFWLSPLATYVSNIPSWLPHVQTLASFPPLLSSVLLFQGHGGATQLPFQLHLQLIIHLRNYTHQHPHLSNGALPSAVSQSSTPARGIGRIITNNQPAAPAAGFCFVKKSVFFFFVNKYTHVLLLSYFFGMI